MAPKNHPGFSSGRTVKARDLQYIQRPADAELLDHCQNGRPAYILHSPQMGKSSLIAHTAEQLKVSSHHAIIMDLSQFPLLPRENEWFHNIVRILDDSLDISTSAMSWWKKPSVFALPPHRRLTKLMTEVILPEMTTPLVLFIDEIEQTVALPFREHIFEWLATLYESRETHSILYRLSFVVCGVATPSQLIPEGGPLLFQWSHRVRLSDFTLQEALPLAEGLSLPTEAAIETVKWIHRWTNGHPYLTQLLCQVLEEQQRKTWLEADVDECIRHFIVSPQGIQNPNLQFVRTALTEPAINGVLLLAPYVDLLEGNPEALKSNQAALEQLRLAGVLRDDDEEIAIRNALYQEVFSSAWAKSHLHPRTPTPATAPPHPPVRQQSYVMAASIFLIGVGLLLWFFRAPVSTPLSVTSQHSPSASMKPLPIVADSTETPNTPQQPEALTHAQEKVQELEATIVRYQQLSSGEVQSLIDQRTQLETQLASKDRVVSDLDAKMQALESTLIDQRDAQEHTIADLQTERAQWQTKATTTGKELESALEEVKTLQMAVLKQSSLSPSEINKLMTDRSQLDTQLKTANTELALAHERARGLEARLTQQQQFMQTESQRLVEGQTRLEEQIKSAESALHEARLALKTTETSAQEQAKLARTELARLQKERSDYQEKLRSRQQIITALETQAEKSATTMSERDQNLQHAQQTINGLTAELQEVREQESQARDRISQLDLILAEQRQTTDRTLLARQQEGDQLKTQLALAQQKLNTKKTRMASLADQLAGVQQTAAKSQNTIKTIHASSSEKSLQAENQIAALTHTRTELETRLRESEKAFHQAQQRIAELETNSTSVSETENHVRQTIEERDQIATQLNVTRQQLSKAQEHIQSLEQTLTAVSSAGKRSGADRPLSSKAANSLRSGSPHEENLVKMVSTITTKLSQSPGQIKTEMTRLLWARQAYLLNLRTRGTQWAMIDRSLRTGLHTSPIQLKGVSGRIHTLTFDPSGDHIIAGTSNGKMLMWSISHPLNSPQIFTGHSAGVISVTVSPNGQHLASGSLDSTIRIWNLTQPNNTPPRILQGHSKGVTSLAFRPDGKQLASGSQDHTVRLWDMTSHQLQPTILGTHAGRVNAIAYTPDGKNLLSGGDDLTLRIWDLRRTDSQPKILRGHRRSIATIAIHPSGWMIATGSRDRNIGLWNLRQSPISPTFLTGSAGRISQVQFSSDGTSLASVSSDKSLRIWDWHEPSQPPIQFPGHKGTLKAMTISPDGQIIAVGGSSQSVTLWSNTGQLAHAVCDSAKENIAFTEWKQIVGEGIPYERTCPNLPLHPSFLEEGKRLAKQGFRDQAQTIFERAKQLDPYLKLDPKKEAERLSAKSS